MTQTNRRFRCSYLAPSRARSVELHEVFTGYSRKRQAALLAQLWRFERELSFREASQVERPRTAAPHLSDATRRSLQVIMIIILTKRKRSRGRAEGERTGRAGERAKCAYTLTCCLSYYRFFRPLSFHYFSSSSSFPFSARLRTRTSDRARARRARRFGRKTAPLASRPMPTSRTFPAPRSTDLVVF